VYFRDKRHVTVWLYVKENPHELTRQSNAYTLVTLFWEDHTCCLCPSCQYAC